MCIRILNSQVHYAKYQPFSTEFSPDPLLPLAYLWYCCFPDMVRSGQLKSGKRQ